MTTTHSPLAPPAIIIPPRTALRTTNRRRSLPSPSVTPPARRSANYVNVKPASPAVISSLLSTLSAISPPAGSRFEDLPEIYTSHSTPVSPLPYEAEFPLIIGPDGHVYLSDPALPSRLGCSMECEPSRSPRDLKKLHPCPSETARGLTVYKSPRRSSSDISLRSKPNRLKIREEDGLSKAYSIGGLSIEPGPASSITSGGGGGHKNLRNFRSLKFENSIDDLRKDVGNLKYNSMFSGQQHDTHPGSHKVNVDGLRFTPCESPTIFEETMQKDMLSAPTRIPSRASSLRVPATKEGLDSQPDDSKVSSDCAGLSRQIPTRDSSLRRSCCEPSTHGKRRSYWSDQSGPQELERFSFEKNRDQPTPQSEEVVSDLAEGDVSRRIRELKDQKKLRDHTMTSTASEPVTASGAREPSRTPSPLPLVDIMLFETGEGDLQASRANKSDQSGKDETVEFSAPSPAIMQRINRNKTAPVSSMPSKTTSTKSFPLITHNTDPKAASPVLPQRSNSRLLRRLSRPVSPKNPEKPKRTFSNPLIDERPKSVDSIDNAVDDYISSPRLSQKIKHPQTGRLISFSEVGDPNGSTVFCCVGMGLTRYITAFYDELALTLKLRLITPDRPGVGGSEPYADGLDTPLGWPDDVLAICQHLKLTKFSILAHSAGAIYALATALRMPQHIRGRIHLLAPWIPPSQMFAFGTQQEALPVTALPYSQRFLRSLPTPFLRAANSSFLSATSASITTSLPKSPRRAKRKSLSLDASNSLNGSKRDPSSSPVLPEHLYSEASISKEAALSGTPKNAGIVSGPLARMSNKERQSAYEIRLTEAIWNSATRDANPAVDLLTCLERRQPIGFRYVDITRSVVIHHGNKDNRVPVENVKWLGKTMRRCEVRVLEGEGHGLMASAAVLGGVLMEMAKEWEDWIRLVKGKGGTERKITR